MIPYILIFLLVFFAYWYKNPNSQFAYFFIMFCCMVMVGSRDMIGGYDVYVYGQTYESPNPFLFGMAVFEKGYLWYNVLLKKIVDNRYFLFFVSAIIIFYTHFTVIRKLSPLLLFSIFVYFCKFFLMSFVYLRQFLAVGIIWLAVPMVMQNKKIMPLLLLVFAFTFHEASIVFLPFIFLGHIKFTKTVLIISVLVFLAVFLSPLGNTIMLSFLGLSTREDRFNLYNVEDSLNIFYLIEVVFLTTIGAFFKDDFYKKENTTYIFNGLFFCILLTIMSMSNGTFVRFTWVYYLFVVLALPYMYLFIQQRVYKNLFRWMVFLYFATIIIRMLVIWDGGDFIPYKAFYINSERHGAWDFYEYRYK